MEAQTWVRLHDDMKDAMRAREADKLGTIRMLISTLKNKRIELRQDLTEEEIVDVLSTEVKKRREAAEMYRKGDRADLADKEESEIVIIQNYLPAQLSEADVAAIVEAVIAETGASSKKDMGKVMGPVVAQTKGRFDGSKIKDIVMAKLP